MRENWQNSMSIQDSEFGAFCTDRPVTIAGSAAGPLTGLTFAAKDVFDIAGFKTGAGNPDWLRTHPPARYTAPAVQCVLDAGASLAGKTHTDELTYSLNGENFHYGTPLNPKAHGRIPGGSSSGSASATAGGLVDFALGTDTGGSVRLPASNCGIFGFRPTHGRVTNEHVVPLAPSFDTVGWFARDAGLLKRVGDVLLSGQSSGQPLNRLLVPEDAFELAYPEVRTALNPPVGKIIGQLGPAQEFLLYAGNAEDWMMAFRILQGAEIWHTHGDWIRQTRPVFGAGVRERFEWASRITPEELPGARAVRKQASHYLDEALGEDGVLCVPTSPTIALPRGVSADELDRFRSRALTLLCVAGLARLPQVSLPLSLSGGCPLGVSLIGPRNSDRQLLKAAAIVAG